MTLNERIELANLLYKYMGELTLTNARNIKCGSRFHMDYVCGIKSQYEHARRILNRITLTVNRDLEA